MTELDDAWQRYWRNSYVQMAAVAAMAEIEDIDDIEERMSDH